MVGNVGGLASIHRVTADLQLQTPDTDANSRINTYMPSGGIMSGADLMARMGGAPKENVNILGFFVKTNSTAYKGVLENLQTYQGNVDAIKDKDVARVPASVINSLKDQLASVVAEADKYLAQHGTDAGKAGRREVMTDIKQMAQDEIGRLDQLNTLTGTDTTKVSLGNGLNLLRGGVTDVTAFSSAFNDDTIVAANSKIAFNSGKANTVDLIAYGTDMRVVKPISKQADKLMAGEATTGFDQTDMRTAARNVASSNVAELLGIGPSIPMPEIVIHNHSAALSMPVAAGESLIIKVDIPVTDLKDVARYDSDLKSNFLDNLKSAGVKFDENQNCWVRSTAQFKEMPYISDTNPALRANLQKAMLDLQVCDCLMGQMDRQPENIFIQIDGNKVKVTGIDNDMCMGKKLTHLDALDTGPLRADLKSTYGGPPPLMSREMYDKIVNLTDDDFKAALGPQFTPEEVGAAVSRLHELQNHAENLNVSLCIVDNFATWRGSTDTNPSINASDFLMQSDMRSYIKRDASTLAKVQPTAIVALDAGKHNLV